MHPFVELPRTSCTGCGACMNVCPKDAIKLVSSDRLGETGFLYPEVSEDCIQCSKCIKICPVLHPNYGNAPSPRVYSLHVDQIRDECSSGGTFGYLARCFIEDGGAVCGAKFDEDLVLRETIISSIDDLYDLERSKYVQSDPGFVYREVASVLK